MSENRFSLFFSISRTVNRARNRGLSETASTIRSAARAWLGSESHLKLLVTPAGGEAASRGDLLFRKLTNPDAALYARDIGTDSASTFEKRLTAWTHCYAVVEQDRLLHASWVTTSRAWTNEIRGYICPPVGDAYVYESFTRAETRGRGIYPFALSSIRAALAKEGLGRVWVGVEATNAPSIRAITKAGFEEAFEFGFSRRFGRVRVAPARGPLAEQGRTMIRSARASSF